MAEKLKLEPNVPVQIALKFATGRICDSQYGDEKQAFFTLVDGRTIYLSLGVANSINNLQLKPQEPFMICKYWNGQKGHPARINVWLTPEGERSRADHAMPHSQAIPAADPPSMLERQLAASIAEAQSARDGQNLLTRRPPASSEATHGPVPVTRPASAAAPPWAAVLEAKANALVDVYAACLEHGLSKHGGRVKPEEIRAMLTTVYIAMTKNGASSHAA